MHQSRVAYFMLSAIFVILSFTFISAQTAERSQLKVKPNVIQTKPQADITKTKIEQLITSLPADRKKTFKTVSTIVAKQLIENMGSSKNDRRKADDARQILAAAMDKTAVITNATDANTLMQNTMYAAMYGVEIDLKQLAAQVSANNQIKKIIREEISNLKDILSDWLDDNSAKVITYRECIKLKDGSYQIEERTRMMSKEQVEVLIDDMENQLATLSDRNEMDNKKLQDAMNKQAQIMQMMSNIMKNMHDTANATIQNLK